MRSVTTIVGSIVEFLPGFTYSKNEKWHGEEDCYVWSFTGCRVPLTHNFEVNEPFNDFNFGGASAVIWRMLKAEGHNPVGSSFDYDGGSCTIYLGKHKEPTSIRKVYHAEFDGDLLYEFKTEQDFLEFKHAWEHGPTPQHRILREPKSFPCYYSYYRVHGTAYVAQSQSGCYNVPVVHLHMQYFYKADIE